MQIIGHRGARAEAPENTLGGFAYLANLGIDAVEFDVRQIFDANLVVIHDDNLLRTAGVDQAVATLEYNKLQQFDQRQHWDNWPEAEALPLLSQVMQLVGGFSHIEVEIKAVDSDADAERLIDALLAQLSDYQAQVTITSFDLKILTQLQQAHTDFKRGLLVELPFAQHAVDLAQQLGCTRIGWKDALVDAALIDYSHQAGLAVSVWTVNDVERAKFLQDLGVEGLITDRPQFMLDRLAG